MSNLKKLLQNLKGLPMACLGFFKFHEILRKLVCLAYISRLRRALKSANTLSYLIHILEYIITIIIVYFFKVDFYITFYNYRNQLNVKLPRKTRKKLRHKTVCKLINKSANHFVSKSASTFQLK